MSIARLKCTCPKCGTEHWWQHHCANRREADSWEWYHADFTDRLCPDCFRQAAAEAREAANAAATKAAAEQAATDGLPVLTGTEKQVAWALTIRDKAIHSFGIRDNLVPTAIRVASKWTEARWWIDQRNNLERYDEGNPFLVALAEEVKEVKE